MILSDVWYSISPSISFFIALKFRGDAEGLQVGGKSIVETKWGNLEQLRVPDWG
jgi:hypothetical protein